MLKIFKIIILVILSFTLSSVNALTPKVEYIDNVYSNRIVDGKSISGQLGYIYINNFLAFCIDPMKIIGKDYRIYTDKLDDYYTKEQQRKLKLTIHYGSGTHVDNQYYYMATQELIWRLNNDGEFYFTNIDGEKIDIEKYKEEILNNVERHDILPSFDKITITPKLYETLILKDENNVLNGYGFKSGKNTIGINGNELKIKIDNPNPTTIKLSKLYFSGSLSRTYIGDGQTLITSYFDEEQEVSINVVPTGVSYYIGVKIKEGNNLVLDKVKFKIYNHNTSNYVLDGKVFETDNLGYYESDFKLDPGTYEIVYTDIPYSYISSKTPNIFTLDKNTEVDGAYRHTVISYLEKPHGLLKINRGVIKYDKSIYKLDNIEYEIYASTNIYNNSKLIYKKNQLIETISTVNGYVEIKLPMGKYYIIEKDNNYGINKSNKQYVTFKYIDSTTDEYIVNKEINTPLPTFNLIMDTYKENINKTYSGYEYFKYEVIASHDIYYFGDLVYKKGDIILKLKSDINGYINKKFNLLPGKYIIREKTISDIYYDYKDMGINYSDVNNNILNYTVYKKLKRGNLLVRVYSELDEKMDKLTFFYDNNIKYDIIDELLLEDIKIGDYKVFYDKEYVVNIKENETTILEIKLLKDKKEESDKDDKSEEKDNKGESDKGNKSEEKDNKGESDKGDKSEEKDNKGELDKGNKSEEKDNKGESDKGNKSEEKDNKGESDKGDKSEEKDNKGESDKGNKSEEKSNKGETDNEEKLGKDDNSKKDIKELEHEYLPNTFNYLKQYCTLYELFIISGLIIKLYAKKDK